MDGSPTYIVCTEVMTDRDSSLLIINRVDDKEPGYKDIKIARVRCQLLNTEVGYKLYEIRQLSYGGLIGEVIN
jgi:hypothetical protein